MSNHGWHTEVIDLSDIYLAVPWCFLDTSFVLPSNTATQDTKVVYVLMISNLGEDLSELVSIEFVIQELLYIMLRAPCIGILEYLLIIEILEWRLLMDGRQDYSSMSMRRAWLYYQEMSGIIKWRHTFFPAWFKAVLLIKPCQSNECSNVAIK